MAVVTWDIVNKGTGIVLSNGNLTALVPNVANTARASIGKSEGKWYWEINTNGIGGASSGFIGIVNSIAPTNASNVDTTNSRYYRSSGRKYPDNVTYGTTYLAVDTIGVALDLDMGTLTFYKNGVSQGVSHTNIKEMGEVFPSVTDSSGSTLTANFGETPFKYPIPNGYKRYEPVNKILISLGDGSYKSVVPLEYSSSVATPKMTSNSSPFGEVFGSPSFGGNELFNAFSQAGNQYLTSVKENGHIGYKFSNNKTIGKYSLKSNITNVTHNLKNWTFEGSNDGVNYTVLDTQNGISWSSTTEVKEHLISKDKIKPYLYYRLFWTANNGGTYGAIGELGLYEVTLPKLIDTVVSENNYINHGMDKPIELDISAEFTRRVFINQSPTTIGSGKVFKKSIDTSQIPIKGVSIK